MDDTQRLDFMLSEQHVVTRLEGAEGWGIAQVLQDYGRNLYLSPLVPPIFSTPREAIDAVIAAQKADAKK